MDECNYEKGFRLTFENTQRLFKAAESLETNSEFTAISNSLMILAAEEAIKAYTIITQHFFPEKELQDFNKFFEDHKHKINTIRDLIAIRYFIEILDENWKNPILENLDKSPEELSKIKSSGIDNIIKKLDNETNNKKSDITIQNKWWQHAKTMKEHGFYVGFKNGKWSTPFSIKKNQYNKTKKYISEFIECVELIYNLDLTDEHVIDILDKLKTSIVSIKNKPRET